MLEYFSYKFNCSSTSLKLSFFWLCWSTFSSTSKCWRTSSPTNIIFFIVVLGNFSLISKWWRTFSQTDNIFSLGFVGALIFNLQGRFPSHQRLFFFGCLFLFYVGTLFLHISLYFFWSTTIVFSLFFVMPFTVTTFLCVFFWFLVLENSRYKSY